MNEHILTRPRNLKAVYTRYGEKRILPVRAILVFGMKGSEQLYFDLDDNGILLRTNDWHVLRSENVELYKKADQLVKKFKEKK